MKNKFRALFQHRITVNGTISEIYWVVIDKYVRDYEKEYKAEDAAVERYCSHAQTSPSCALWGYDESNSEMRMIYESELQRMSSDPFNFIIVLEDENGHQYPAIIPPVYKYRMMITYHVSDMEYRVEHCITSQALRTFSEARIRVDVRNPGNPIDVMVR